MLFLNTCALPHRHTVAHCLSSACQSSPLLLVYTCSPKTQLSCPHSSRTGWVNYLVSYLTLKFPWQYVFYPSIITFISLDQYLVIFSPARLYTNLQIEPCLPILNKGSTRLVKYIGYSIRAELQILALHPSGSVSLGKATNILSFSFTLYKMKMILMPIPYRRDEMN